MKNQSLFLNLISINKVKLIFCLFVINFSFLTQANSTEDPSQILSDLLATHSPTNQDNNQVKTHIKKESPLVKIESVFFNDQKRFTIKGTGFFIDPTTVITNFFMVSGLLNIEQNSNQDFSVEITIETTDSKKIKIERILHANAAQNLVLLQTTNFKSEHYYNLHEYNPNSLNTLSSIEVLSLSQLESELQTTKLTFVDFHHQFVRTERELSAGNTFLPLLSKGTLVTFLTGKIDAFNYRYSTDNLQSLLDYTKTNPTKNKLNIMSSIKKEFERLNKQIELKEAPALYYLANNKTFLATYLFHFQRKDFDHNMKLLYEAAKEKQDRYLSDAVKLKWQAANQGHFVSKQDLFLQYSYIVSTADPELRFNLLELDPAKAFYDLSQMYNEKEVTDFNYQKYRKFLEKAAKLGHLTAKKTLVKEQDRCIMLFQ